MTVEEKELLLIDLSGRLPYGTFIREYHDNGKIKRKKRMLDANAYAWFKNGVKVKPYLRPMSSMTAEEKTMYIRLRAHAAPFAIVDWLNKNHFDHRTNMEGEHLIEIGLAIKAPEDMYKS